MKLLILDRDGVINHDSPDYIKSPDEWIPIEGSLDAIGALTRAGWTLVVATNQSGIGRGYYDVATLNRIHAKMHRMVHDAGGEIDAVFFCPHMSAAQCRCRKPAPGMVLDIAKRFHVSPTELWMVGDSQRDLESIAAAGGKPLLVRTGNGRKTEAKNSLPPGTRVFDDLVAVADWLQRLG